MSTPIHPVSGGDAEKDAEKGGDAENLLTRAKSVLDKDGDGSFDENDLALLFRLKKSVGAGWSNYGDHRKHKPIFMTLITLTQIAMFVWECFEAGESPTWNSPMGPSYLRYRVTAPGCVDHRLDIWRYFSYQLLHKGLGHLFFNMIMQLVVGVPLEMVHGPWRMFFLYQAGVVCGALNAGVWDPYLSLLGASGGVYTVFGLQLANLFINWSNMPFRWGRLVLISGFMGADLWNYTVNRTVGLSYAAHAGGFCFGAAAGAAILKNIDMAKWERVLIPLVTATGLLYHAFCVYWVATNWPPLPLKTLAVGALCE